MVSATVALPRTTLEAEASSSLFYRVGICAAAAVLLIFPVGSFAAFPPAAVVWTTAGVLAWLAIQTFTVSRKLGENPWLFPLSLMMVFYFVRYGMGALIIYFYDDFPWETFAEQSDFFVLYGMKQNIPSGCQLLLLGALGLYLGCCGSMPAISKWLPALNWPIDTARFKLNLTLYAPLGVFIFLVGGLYLPLIIRDTVMLWGWIIWVMLVIGSYHLFSSQPQDRLKWLTLLLFMTLTLVVTGLQTGMRGNFLQPALLILVGFVLARGYVPWRWVVPQFLIVIFLVVPWLTLYKFAAERGPIPITDRMEIASDQYKYLGIRGLVESGMVNTFGRLAGPGGFIAVFVQYYPEIFPFEMGQSFLFEFEALMPRILWPEKPNLSMQLDDYSRNVGILPSEGSREYGITSAKFEGVSEYYINFGAPGVFFLCMLHGYFVRIIYYWLVKRSHFEIGAPMFLVLFVMNLEFYGVVQLFLSATRQLLVWPLILWVLSRKAR